MLDKKSGIKLKRKKPTSTTQRMVFTTKDNQHWQIRYPNGKERYGACTTSERVAIFFILLGMGHTLEGADEIAFHKTRTRGKYHIIK